MISPNSFHLPITITTHTHNMLPVIYQEIWKKACKCDLSLRWRGDGNLRSQGPAVLLWLLVSVGDKYENHSNLQRLASPGGSGHPQIFTLCGTYNLLPVPCLINRDVVISIIQKYRNYLCQIRGKEGNLVHPWKS